MKVTLKGFIKVPPDELDNVTAHLSADIRLTKDVPGCVLFDVSQRDDDRCVFDVYEAFVDKSAYLSHQERVKTSDWARVTSNVERHYEVIGLQDANS